MYIWQRAVKPWRDGREEQGAVLQGVEKTMENVSEELVLQRLFVDSGPYLCRPLPNPIKTLTLKMATAEVQASGPGYSPSLNFLSSSPSRPLSSREMALTDGALLRSQSPSLMSLEQ